MKPSADPRDERWWLHAFTSARWWAGVVAAWTLFALLMAGYAQIRFGGPGGYAGWVSTMLPFYWSWVPLMPAVVLMVARFDFRPGERGTSVPAHLGAGVVAVLAHAVVYASTLTLMHAGESGGLARTIAVNLRRHGVGDLATYTAAAGAILILQQYRRAQAREREATRSAIRASRLEAQLSAARLDALQMQLHPHFLFNALNSISVMVLKGAGPEAIRAIRRLADLLRATLHTAGTQELPLQEEIAFAQGYLELEKMRFGDRLQIEFDVAGDAAAALVPHLILQPLVENAVVHGLQSRVRDGRIRVAARREDGMLRLEVWDNGAGLPADGSHLSQGVGLSNTRARLQELYRDEGRLTIAPAREGGTLAAISLPYHTETRPAPGGPAT
ncbi:MAG: sensor histidine kinase [Gemmatimonadales bacterium]